MKKPKILVVGSFMMDLIASTKRAPQEGETVIGTSFHMAPGGKGANQAVQCARLGAQTTMVGCVGDDSFGKTLLGALTDAGVDVSHVIVDPTAASGVGHITLEVSDADAKNRITVCPGANFSIRKQDIMWLKDTIGEYDLVMMQLEIPMEIVETVAIWAWKAGVPVMLNPAPAAKLTEDLLGHLTYISPNEHEVAAMCGCAVTEDGQVKEYGIGQARDWFLHAGVKNLIVTLGGNGSLLVSDGEYVKADCVTAPAVLDTTAAGDSFVAAFCVGVATGLSKKRAMDLAGFTAAITVSRLGAIPSLPTLQEVQTFMLEKGYDGFDPAALLEVM